MEAGDNQQASSHEGKDMMDTVTLEKLEREKRGSWESEFSFGGEADLHRHYKNCPKNPGHLKFIPVDEFNINHLPSGYRDNDIVDFIHAMANVTVRVTVTYVSGERSKIVRGSDMPDPYYSYRGMDKMRVGTGWISGVTKFMDELANDGDVRTCTCMDCLNSPTPKTQFARIFIMTAAHVVYDNLEGEHTTCQLFFDRDGIPDACSGVLTLDETSHERNISINKSRYVCEIDAFNMQYVTHDLDLADRLDKLCYRCGQLIETLENRYRSSEYDKIPYSESVAGTYTDRPEAVSVPNTWHPLTIIVSHPHGCSKQVSIGHCTNMDHMENDGSSFIYSTATCPGSSGARVCVIGRDWWGEWGYGHAHSGKCEGNMELNYSCPMI